MRHTSRFLVPFVLAIVAACSAQVQPAVPPTMPCGGPSALVDNPGWGPIAKAGPIGMRGDFGDTATTAVIRWSPGSLAKVLIGQVEPSDAFTVTGLRCRDGKSLRFWYDQGPPFIVTPTSTPVPDSVFETIGNDHVAFDADPNVHPPDRMVFKTGYMLFTSADLWRVEVRANGKLLGTAILHTKVR